MQYKAVLSGDRMLPLSALISDMFHTKKLYFRTIPSSRPVVFPPNI